MQAITESFHLFFEPVALTVMLVYLFGLVSRSQQHPSLRKAFMGATFGLAAIYSMLSPITLAEGFILDLRNLFVGVAAAFFGWVAGLIALALSMAMRVQIGGAGMLLGVASMSIAAFAGMAWRLLVRSNIKSDTLGSIVLGGMISGHLTVSFLLPIELRSKFWAEIGPSLIGMNIVGAFLLSKMLHREEALIAEKNALQTAAETDPLTNLINRRTLCDVAEGLAQPHAPDLGHAVIYLDLDHFKSINDTFGHKVGDSVLLEIVSRIRRCLRPDDIFARIGGDEFSVVLPNVSEASARRAAQRCCSAVSEKSMQINGHTIDASISMGVVWTNKQVEFEHQLVSADTELYNSKADGRNKVSFKSANFSDVRRPHRDRLEVV